MSCLGLAAWLLAAAPVALPAARDARWATPLERPGLDNLFQVGPDLFRAAQPDPAGYPELAKLGVRTIVSLRAFHSERKAVLAQGIGYERISFKVWHPEHEDVRRFLAIVTNPDRRPVFVHCQRGADRTGMMVAVYRICVQGWNNEAAVDEMVHGGTRFNPAWKNLVGWVRRFDPRRHEGCVAAAGPQANSRE